MGLIDAEEALLKRKRVLGEMLNLSPEEAERLEVRGKLLSRGPPPPAAGRTDRDRPRFPARRGCVPAGTSMRRVQTSGCSGRTGFPTHTYSISRTHFKITRLSAGKAAHRGRWGSRFRCRSTTATRETSSERGSTSTQTQQQLAFMERRLATEVQQALGEYQVSGRIVQAHSRRGVARARASLQDAHSKLLPGRRGSPSSSSWTRSASTTTRSRRISIRRRGTAAACST